MQPQSYQSVTYKWSLHTAGDPMAPLQITESTWMNQGGFQLFINLASQPPSEHHTQFHSPVWRLERSTEKPQRVSTRGREAKSTSTAQGHSFLSPLCTEELLVYFQEEWKYGRAPTSCFSLQCLILYCRHVIQDLKLTGMNPDFSPINGNFLFYFMSQHFLPPPFPCKSPPTFLQGWTAFANTST